MSTLRLSEIENALLSFRTARGVAMRLLTQDLLQSGVVSHPALFLARFFCRLKSADSILEKMCRTQCSTINLFALPNLTTDVLGFRLIVEDPNEMQAVDRFLKKQCACSLEPVVISSLHELEYQGAEYNLRFQELNGSCPFEVQVRTILQQHWASRTIHLFHKRAQDAAKRFQDELAAFGGTLREAERCGATITDKPDFAVQPEGCDLAFALLNSTVHLVVVGSSECVRDHVLCRLTGNASDDHSAIIDEKGKLYEMYPGAHIIECSCLNWSSFLLNEPQARLPIALLTKSSF